ncbi:arsenate reductase family protein [Chryseobacterium pennae]|uniref:Arsenate reductase family protein n=1 Tax=Chryseobacterium pennae TaxID=2258962 RepID=A0A3D9C8E0_9FLAO|nr:MULTISPECIES: ArsC/Spx/MgsR family protein [Chryseobacterium]MCS4302056.1 arsenate reductase-like glutaredoxin family protein [Chryseobacterium sp. BIGb0232]REC62145.1 arsenate reductase family protein [Chryseobacterium pennae]ROS18004.1 arsenate reductase-like glutaredoxin family protein [Chryseobacterium nakagawai]
MKKVFHLNTCDTCRKILAQFNLKDWELREIKKEPITKEELEEMHKLTKSYEALFSKKSTQIKLRELDVKTLGEKDFKELILDHYTFLKRPVFMTDKEIFVGNDKNNIEALRTFFRME